jgi:hypothetical protein
MLKRQIITFILSGAIFLYFPFASAQTYTSTQSLNWQIITKISNKKINAPYFLGFDNATYTTVHPTTPVFSIMVPLALNGTITTVLKNEVYVPETDPVIAEQLNYLGNKVEINSRVAEIKSGLAANVSFVPIRKNTITGQIEKLAGFTLNITIDPVTTTRSTASSMGKRGTAGSLLAAGNWYKIGVSKTGIYKLDYNFLKSLGIPDNTSMSNIKIYGRPGGMLPQMNTAPRDYDLVQNAVQAVSNSGKLDASSYILFYAKGPVSWSYDPNTDLYHHQVNYYSDVSYYFVTADGDPDHPAKRIQDASTTGAPDQELSTFTAYDYHELDTVTSITTSVKSGREWFGENFTAYQQTLYHNINFDFPQADLSANMYMNTATAARSFPGGSSFDFSLDGGHTFVLRNSVAPVYSTNDFVDSYDMTNEKSATLQIPSTHFSVNVSFNPGASDASGWLNYIEFNVPSRLKYIQGQFGFRTGKSLHNAINRYHLSGAPGNLSIWDVTDFHDIIKKPVTPGSNEITFTAPGDVLREFVAFDGTGFYTPFAFGKIANQDLHSLPQPDMVILTYPDFKPGADSIAQYHRIKDNMVVHVITPDQVYNEFSSGTQDISAIRDMMKMFYDRDPSGNKPRRFLLLVGAASYDYKDRVKSHTNFIPTYQGYESSFAANSFCSDDYFGILADGRGGYIDDGVNDSLKVSIGRLPVYSLQQTMDIYHKIQRYSDKRSMGDWRNRVCFIADDRASNMFESQTENLSNVLRAQQPELNQVKLFFDATPVESTPAGQIFPQINRQIDQNINKGCLVMNYVGHGGQLGWGHEKVLTIPMINAWKNSYNMPLIISATCQFSTFDDPDNISAGELALLNPYGGPFALFTTTREVDAGSNSVLNDKILSSNLFERDPKTRRPKYIGQAFVDAKNACLSSNNLNFTLLGDPAVRLAMPWYDIMITNISRDGISSDTFKALSLMTISGEIQKDGQIISDFKGDIFPTVFDKPELKFTLGQAATAPDDNDFPMGFNTQETILYKGPASVENGKFSFQFVVPKDISFTNGNGKLSFYADNGVIDAGGYHDSIIVGGSDDNARVSVNPPVVHLFINDTNFVSGGLTDENPVLLAKVKSDLGINTLGSVGHDLLATLTKTDNSPDDHNDPVVLNNYYTADKNSYQSGTIMYPYQDLADGNYRLNVKVWDVANNSAEAATDFIVVSSSKLTIDKIFNYPNPFSTFTTFQFEDNRPNEKLHVEISIFNMGGELVKDLQADLQTAGDRHTEMKWYGIDSRGVKLASGMYVYQLTVKASDGQIAQKSQKLVLIK